MPFSFILPAIHRFASKIESPSAGILRMHHAGKLIGLKLPR
jgi:hypothetical protein